MATEESNSVDGTVLSVVYRNEETGYCVLRVGGANDGSFHLGKAEATVVGRCACVWEGEDLHADGEWVTDKVHGRQFKASVIRCVTPKSALGIERYLASGLIKGIGPEYAKRIVAHFGTDTIEILDHHSGRLREVAGIGETRVERIKKSWEHERGMRDVMMSMQEFGISTTKIAKIYRLYGPDCVAIVKRDPYRLCRDIWGIGFQTADRIALAANMPKDAPERARAALTYTLEAEADEGGHCWTGEPELLQKAEARVGITVEKLAEALKGEVEAGRLVREMPPAGSPDPNARIWLPDVYYAERNVAGKLLRLVAAPRSFPSFDASRAIDWWEKRNGFTLAPAQLRALRTSLGNKVSVITGGPGVGKTTIIRALVDLYSAKKLAVRLAAPTGRAAKRMTEAIFGAAGAPKGGEAQTVHRLLKFNPQTRRFTFSADNPLSGDVFIFDESSMIDIRLAADLFGALPDAATVVIVGDTDQLPSVGPGNVLGDVIRCGTVATTCLTEIFRQDATGYIVRNAHHVNRGEPLEFAPLGTPTDFYFVPQKDPAKTLAIALSFMTERIPRKFGLDPLRDVQVLTPMRRNALGAENLNQEIQKRLNGNAPAVQRGATFFREGDRVMQLRNNYDKDVFNGDIGFIEKADPATRELVVLFDGRPVVYGSADLDELALAYATTIHKSQGSEYPAVVMLLHNQHYMMLQRNLLYTGITRGKKLVMLVGAPWALQRAIETNTVRTRRTALAERLVPQPSAAEAGRAPR